jgi:hypothetical protein
VVVLRTIIEATEAEIAAEVEIAVVGIDGSDVTQICWEVISPCFS